MTRPLEAVQEMLRVTAAGGRIVVGNPDWRSFQLDVPSAGVAEPFRGKEEAGKAELQCSIAVKTINPADVRNLLESAQCTTRAVLKETCKACGACVGGVGDCWDLHNNFALSKYVSTESAFS